MILKGAAAAASIAACVALVMGTPRSSSAEPHQPAAAQGTDASQVARGKQIFSVNCGFCHGSDARGGESGPNLLRSPIVLADRKGEGIAAVVLNGRMDKGMPKFNFSQESIADIAAFVHSVHVGDIQAGAVDPAAILVGNPVAGRRYFFGEGHCNQCHSLRGDLAGIGARLDPKTLQDNIVSGGVFARLGAPLPGAPPQTVTVTRSSGEVIKGTLLSMDDFHLSLTDANGRRRTLRREGSEPRVEVHNPMQAHLDRLLGWEDGDIHNLTAFLAQQK